MPAESTVNTNCFRTKRISKRQAGNPVPWAALTRDRPARRLNKWLILLSLMVVAVLATNIKCVLDFNNATAAKARLHDRGTITVQPGESERGNLAILAAVYFFWNWPFLLFGMNVACFATFMYVLVRRFISPVERMTHAAREIADGNLTVSVPSQGKDEVGTLARALNDVAANYQEVLLLTGIKVGNCRETLGKMEKMLKERNPSPAADELERLCSSAGEDLGMVSDLVKGFDFYEVHFDGKKVVRNGFEDKE